LLGACEAAAIGEGFSRLELAATLPGVPLYKARGFEEFERLEVSLPGGQVLPVVRMRKTLLQRRA